MGREIILNSMKTGKAPDFIAAIRTIGFLCTHLSAIVLNSPKIFLYSSCSLTSQ
jgi:hypothetical protein